MIISDSNWQQEQDYSEDTDLLFLIARSVIKFSVSDKELAPTIEYLLRYHTCSQMDVHNLKTDAVIEFVCGDFGDKDNSICLKDFASHVKRWVWEIPGDAGTWAPERFYYRILFPALSQAFAVLHIARLHGALLFDESIGVVLLLGDRGTGKSSVTAAWLEEGASVSTDDVTLLVNWNGELGCYGVHRELHVDPSLARYLPRVVGLRESKEYLPGAGRVAYDWVSHFPQQCTRALPAPNHIVQSTVKLNEHTKARQLTKTMLIQLIKRSLASETDNAFLPSEVSVFIRRTLELARGWAITWGPDIWEREGKHLTFLQNQFEGKTPTL